MSGGPDLEQRYRRVLRLLPGYYRHTWEEDMVAAFLDSWLTGDPETDEYITRVARPSWAEVASVTGLAGRLYLGGAGTPRRYFAWGQAVRGAVLAVALVHAVRGLGALVVLVWAHRLLGVPAPPATVAAAPPAGVWPAVWYSVTCAWIAIFGALVLGRYRAARLIAALAIVPGLVAALQAQQAGILQAPFASWAFWVLLCLVPVWPCPRSTVTPHPPRDGPGWPLCPLATSWQDCRSWPSWRPGTRPGCRTFPGCAVSWSPSPAWPTHPGPGPAGAPGRGRGR